MNEIRQLCATSTSSSEHFDEILALFHACPPQHLLSSLSLIGQSISCLAIEQLDLAMINHPLFLLIRQWSQRLLQQWLNNENFNGEEYRALFYIHQLFKLISEWFIDQTRQTNDNDQQESMKFILTHLFLDENFLKIVSQVIQQLIDEHQSDEISTVATTITAASSSQADNFQTSPEEVFLETQTSDTQADPSEVNDVLFRFVNTVVTLFNHRTFSTHPSIEKYVTPCILHCLNSSLFIRLARKFFFPSTSTDKIDIRSIFLLSSCLDFCTVAKISSSTYQLIPSIRQILGIWSELSSKTHEEISPLIVRLIRLIYQLVLFDSETIIRENLCVYLVPHFSSLCQIPNVTDDTISILLVLSSTPIGKEYLRQLETIQYVLPETKRQIRLWQPVSLLITPNDFHQANIFKRLIYLLIQRTISIFQTLATATNDTSFDSTTPSTKNQMALAAIEWIELLRTNFLIYTMIVDEFISSAKKNNFLNMFIDTILALEQEEDITPNLIDELIELLWTLTLSTSTNIHEHLQKRVDLYRWLKSNINDGTPTIRLASQAILSTLDFNTNHSARLSTSRRSSMNPTILICMLNADPTCSQLCMTLRDQIQTERQYSVELVTTPVCQTIDSLINLVNRSSVCLFCVTTRMKFDNLSHFIYRYLISQSSRISMFTILLERDCQVDGTWLLNMPMIHKRSILKHIRRHLNGSENPPVRVPSRASDHLSTTDSHVDHIVNDDFQSPSRHFQLCPISHWTTEDVADWCEASKGSFDTIQPLMIRLNGPSLIHLAEILSIEPAEMYHRLNDELLQRTGTSLPLTEYVSLSSELQRLLLQRENHSITTSVVTPSNDLTKKKRRKATRFCTLF